jgi:hypothetical protein
MQCPGGSWAPLAPWSPPQWHLNHYQSTCARASGQDAPLNANRPRDLCNSKAGKLPASDFRICFPPSESQICVTFAQVRVSTAAPTPIWRPHAGGSELEPGLRFYVFINIPLRDITQSPEWTPHARDIPVLSTLYSDAARLLPEKEMPGTRAESIDLIDPRAVQLVAACARQPRPRRCAAGQPEAAKGGELVRPDSTI